MSVKLFGVRLHVGVFAAAAIACMVNYGQSGLYAVFFGSVALHESVHLLLMRAFGCRRPSVEVLPGGVRIRDEDFVRLGYLPTAVCLLGAPVVNLLAAGVLLLCCDNAAPNEWLRQAVLVNGGLGIVNLLPLSILDGGCALDNLLRASGRENLAVRAAFISDALCLSFIGCLTALTFLFRRPSVPLLIFFVYCLTAVLSGRKNKG